MQHQNIRFSQQNPDFFSTLNKRVNEYFKTNNISRQANHHMIVKTCFMFALYFVPYALIISGIVTSLWMMTALCCVMGMGIAGIGLSVMHDANHGAYSNKKWINTVLGYSLNIVGGNAFNWRVQHNVLHHTYTNIHDVDEDISPRGVLRMSPHGEWKYLHQFQHIYAWFLYGLMTIVWVLVKDFVRIQRYHHDGLITKQKTTLKKEWTVLLLTKAAYTLYIFVLPAILLSNVTWWHTIVGFFIMHYIAGFVLAIIFQPAHVIDGTEYPLPNDEGDMENSWAIHQLTTTTNFANKSRIFSWYVGGLNFQIEHHLFPNVCHIHYKQISAIVQKTAQEFQLPYKTQPTFFQALLHHAKLLKALGARPPQLVMSAAK